MKSSNIFFFFLTVLSFTKVYTQTLPREKLSMDKNWRFSLGHAHDTQKDFNHGTAYFSFYAKAGFADGPASPSFDDRAWRKLDLPHDWAVEALFDSKGSLSHGFKAIGRNFPERSIGWYRKTFFIPKSDDGRRISVEFDGVFRNSVVWVNGHYLGIEPSGYSSFRYDLTDYLHYGGDNVITVRVDATMEEGWFYEGAGIYRHVWLMKTNPLHVDYNGTFVHTDVKSNSTSVNVNATIVNDGKKNHDFSLRHIIVNAQGKKIDSVTINNLSLSAGDVREYTAQITLNNPTLWSLENPYLYKMITLIFAGEAHSPLHLRGAGDEVDIYETPFGVRTIRWDPDKGFFLNGEHVQLKGTNNHQDHAGVGAAIPDELQRFRIMTLKELGANAYRCSHNPPTPELLKACDALGMLVIDENRLMGTSDQILKELKRMIVRDRNHPSIIAWSLGNEEWALEGSETGARIAITMQDHARRLDNTRPYTVAISGGWGQGISTVIDVMGYNYISHGSTDTQHKDFPHQAGMGTEEGATFSTRGIYVDDKEHGHLNAYDWDPSDWGASAEEGWSYYNSRDYLAGMFIWSGFDYRGEPTPFGWPAIVSQFGVLDLCGFPKDNAFYYKSWWTSAPMVHLFPHWNQSAWQSGENVKVWSYTNCEEIELFLNGRSMGKQKVKKDSHAEWNVTYKPGTLESRGYIGGKKVASDVVYTTGKGNSIQLRAHQPAIHADGEDLAIITVSELDSKKRFVPDANDEITFTIQGPGKIIGVGNGDPSSHEADKYIDDITAISVTGWKVKIVDSKDDTQYVGTNIDDNSWATAFIWEDDNYRNYAAKVFSGNFEVPEKTGDASIRLFLHSVGEEQNIYLNGKALKLNLAGSPSGHELLIDPSLLKSGKNTITIVATPYKEKRKGGALPASIQIIKPAEQWKRKLFNGLAQVIVQSTGEPGEIVLKAASGILTGEIKIKVNQAPGAAK